ncbi:hypothetical protein [Chamaesiphon sp. VAR_69_metabat_338]|uniref:hypothetical protein n=1 Tax=Chamaesiphon sp. VAR_69_metabat_338 TaxID=2964704 RepID=UPI00286DF273|nr:hypothetical protein [Chamaesiphon sp. VAR_69_metabat_338]
MANDLKIILTEEPVSNAHIGFRLPADLLKAIGISARSIVNPYPKMSEIRHVDR